MEQMEQMKQMEQDKPSTAKKPYGRPVIEVYGDVRTITQQIGTLSSKNDGGGGNTKTA